MKFTRITVNPNQMGGVPCIRGLRIPVATIVGMVADGMSEEEILKSFPDMEHEDIKESLRYASEAVREREIPLVTSKLIFWWIMPFHHYLLTVSVVLDMIPYMFVNMDYNLQMTILFFGGLPKKIAYSFLQTLTLEHCWRYGKVASRQ